MNKVHIIKAKTEDELVEKMNTETPFFASQPIQKKDGTWVCFIYSKEETAKEEKPAEEPATPSQLSYLEKLGFNGNYDNLSKKEASKKIEELLEKKPQNY